MRTFLKKTSLHGVSLSHLLKRNKEVKQTLQEAVQRGIKEGIVKPLNNNVFSLKNHIEAIETLKMNNAEKNILDLKKENGIQPYWKAVQGPGEIAIIAGTKSKFWLDVAEWLAQQGARRLAVLIKEVSQEVNYLSRIKRISHHYQCNFIFIPAKRIESVEDAKTLLRDLSKLGNVSSIFCIGMEEHDIGVNLEAASREEAPHLRQFVSLLGADAAVCEARAAGGLPAVCVQASSPLNSPAHILPGLSSVLADHASHYRSLLVSGSAKSSTRSDVLGCQSLLPSSVDELCVMGLSVCDRPRFTEQVSRSPGFRHVCHTLVPMFVVAGLGPDSVQPLVRQLVQPVFCCSLPASVDSVNQFAQSLLKEVTGVQSRGPYSLVGDAWSGAVVLTLGCLLEARGHRVELVLIDGAPHTGQERVQALCEQYGADLASSLLATTLSLNKEVEKVFEIDSWEDKLQLALEQVPASVRGSVGRALTCLYSQLTALQQFQPPSPPFQGKVTLITSGDDTSSDVSRFSQLFQAAPTIETVHVEDYRQLLAHKSTAAIVSENAAFTWKS